MSHPLTPLMALPRPRTPLKSSIMEVDTHRIESVRLVDAKHSENATTCGERRWMAQGVFLVQQGVFVLCLVILWLKIVVI